MEHKVWALLIPKPEIELYPVLIFQKENLYDYITRELQPPSFHSVSSESNDSQTSLSQKLLTFQKIGRLHILEISYVYKRRKLCTRIGIYADHCGRAI
jgi:hypothetical protein